MYDNYYRYRTVLYRYNVREIIFELSELSEQKRTGRYPVRYSTDTVVCSENSTSYAKCSVTCVCLCVCVPASLMGYTVHK